MHEWVSMLFVRFDKIISNNLKSIVGILHLYYLENGLFPQLGNFSLGKTGDQLVGNCDNLAGEIGLIDVKVGKAEVDDELRKVESNLVLKVESSKVLFLVICSDGKVEIEEEDNNQNEDKANGGYFEASVVG